MSEDTDTETEESRNARMKRAQLAFLEFTRDGAVTTARCDVCQSLIQMIQKSSSYEMKCDCGRYDDVMRGL